jgi:nitrogen regulatory protein P-II 1
MRYVLAFLPPDRLDAVVEALAEAHVHGLTVSEARGFGQEHDADHPEHRSLPGIETTKKLRLEVVCRDEEVEGVVNAFWIAAHTGRRGDGKVFVLPVLEALRLKTGERGDDALGPPPA